MNRRRNVASVLVVCLSWCLGSASVALADSPDVVFVPTANDIVLKMLEVGGVKKGDVVYDLGCGDGRIVAMAAKRFGCKGVGFDINPVRVRESNKTVKKLNVGHLVKIEEKNIFDVDLSKASVIMLYLLPALNKKLIPQLNKMKPGSRIVSHEYGMDGGATPDKTIKIISREDNTEHKIYLYTIPLKKKKEKS